MPDQNPELIVEIEQLTKVYDAKQRVVALDGIDLTVRQGEIFGLLGPNGAGKTTTISICTTRTLPTSGKVRIAGIDVVKQPSQARQFIGVVPQYNTLDRSLTIFENIYYHCRYFGFSNAQAKARASELLAQFLLTERKDAYPSQLSGGLAQRVQIARAIAHRPKVLFLDEPSAGLDPQSRIAMWTAVQGLRKEGITVVLTTHYMEEADELSDRVAVVDRGKVLALGSPQHLKDTHGAQTIIDLKLRNIAGAEALASDLRLREGVKSAETLPDGLRVFAGNVDGLLPEIIQSCAKLGLRDISITEPSLETVFIQLTGRDLRE
ncbi:ABC transporter ATP-binding protein [Acidicapsa ligni]|uniref:ABC transporter ATP-binding protein n=1 Tax=Acidicapsa ligni TaxID=542300 RepID=UPI0021DFEF34|nr:ATP-binding cassette domain-containing protein [Acidicapsa ligni]